MIPTLKEMTDAGVVLGLSGRMLEHTMMVRSKEGNTKDKLHQRQTRAHAPIAGE